MCGSVTFKKIEATFPLCIIGINYLNNNWSKKNYNGKVFLAETGKFFDQRVS